MHMSKKWDQMTKEEREAFLRENPWMVKIFKFIIYAAALAILMVIAGVWLS